MEASRQLILDTFMHCIQLLTRWEQDASLADLLTPLLKYVLDTTHIDPSVIGDVVIGNVLPPSSMVRDQIDDARL